MLRDARAWGNPEWFAWLDRRFGNDCVNALMLVISKPSLDRTLRPFMEKSPLLLNPRWYKKLSWDELALIVPRSKQKAKNSVDRMESLMVIKNKKDFDKRAIEMFPPRTKMDLALRRSRMFDFFSYLKSKNKEDLRYIFTIIKDSYDYIFVMNILCLYCCVGKSFFINLNKIGAFDDDLEHYNRSTKWLSDKIKNGHVLIDNKLLYAEASTLGGYRNAPYPGFDPVVETENLAHGGNRHNLWSENLDELIATTLKMNIPDIKTPTFYDYIHGGTWTRSGSSSMGRMEVRIADRVKSIKARKNMAIDVLDLNELYKIALNWDKQENYSIIKSELGKLRVAVASDLPMYLQMSWILEGLGHSYNQWPGSTLEEDFVQQSQRMIQMLNLILIKRGMPFDYAAFDHQPETVEIVAILTFIIDLCEKNFLHDHVTFKTVRHNILRSFCNAKLTWKADRKTFIITGGLCSGLRITSLIGNAWNTIMTELAIRSASQLGVSRTQVIDWIRGDDSAIFTDTWAEATAIKVGYDSSDVLAGEGKFSIQQNAMEFLRIWYEDGRAAGYFLRALPGLTQRKPWSSTPWERSNVIKAIHDTFATLKRRQPMYTSEMDKLWLHMKRIWCRDHNLPMCSLSIPIERGGLGVENCDRVFSILPHVPKTRKFVPEVINATTWRSENLTKYFSSNYGLSLSENQADDLARSERAGVLQSDDIPEIAKEYRREWLEVVRKTKFRVREITVPLDVTLPRYNLDKYPLEQIRENIDDLNSKTNDFGSRPHLSTVIQDWKRAKRISLTKLSMTEWIKTYDLISYNMMKAFNKNWHIAERIDYLSGHNSYPNNVLHPLLTSVRNKIASMYIDPMKKFPRLQIQRYTYYTELIVLNSQISQKVYLW